MHSRIELLNTLIRTLNYKSYLEIGVGSLEVFAKIECQRKYSVDPNGQATHNMTSDSFFSTNLEKFDLVYIDGLHHSEQVDRDIINSLYSIHRGATIVLHDCNPRQEVHQRRYPVEIAWYGDVWKSFVKFRKCWNLPAYVLDMDCGCGIIECDMQPAKVADFDAELTWESLERERKELLGLTDPESIDSKIDGRRRRL